MPGESGVMSGESEKMSGESSGDLSLRADVWRGLYTIHSLGQQPPEAEGVGQRAA